MMSIPHALSQGAASVVKKGKTFFTGLAYRVLVHIGGLVLATVAAKASLMGIPGLHIDSSFILAGIYLGFICLIPREVSFRAEWIIPTFLGLLLCVFGVAIGIPWQLTLLIGGLLTWLVRVIWKSGKMGWEWAVTPWLLIALGVFLQEREATYVQPLFYVALFVFLCAGFVLKVLHTRLRTDPIYREKIKIALQSIQGQLLAKNLPGPLETPVRQLVELTNSFTRRCKKIDDTIIPLVTKIETTMQQVHQLGSRRNPALWDDQVGKVFAAVAELNTHLTSEVDKLEPVDDIRGTITFGNGDGNTRMEAFKQSALQLMQKRRKLPLQMQSPIEGIYKATENILECMRTDKQDFAPGEKFLARYLTSTHMVVDEYIKLSRDGAGYENVSQVLERSDDLLVRLEQAFIQEHASLLQNDTLNFSAELSVLDTLLKMSGR